jgi:hypothetical protein
VHYPSAYGVETLGTDHLERQIERTNKGGVGPNGPLSPENLISHFSGN